MSSLLQLQNEITKLKVLVDETKIIFTSKEKKNDPDYYSKGS